MSELFPAEDAAELTARPVHDESKQPTLFDVEPDWREDWWGMPAFDMKDARPGFHITINFMTAEDVDDFAKKSGIPVTSRSDSAWFPPQTPLSGQFQWDGPPPRTNTGWSLCELNRRSNAWMSDMSEMSDYDWAV